MGTVRHRSIETLAATCVAAATFALTAVAADAPVVVPPVRVDAVQIRIEGEQYDVSMPISRLTLRIPQKDLIQRSEPEGTNPRHFHFEQDFPKLALLGAFESSDRYPGAKKLWKYERKTAELNQLPVPQHPKYSRVNGWDVVQFEQTIRGQPTARVTAHYVRAGTWISLELYTGVESKDSLLALLKTLQVLELN